MAFACGEAPASSPDAAARADAALTRTDAGPRADAGPLADAGADDPTAIVDRPSRGAYTCAVERPRADLSPRFWGFAGHSMISTLGGAAFLARIESTPPGPAPARFVVSSITSSKTLGASVEISATNTDMISAPALARRGDGLALIWIEAGALKFAALDGAGHVTTPAKTIPGITLDPYASRPTIAEGAGGGFGVVYVLENAQQKREIWWVALDASGDRSGAPRKIATAAADGLDPAPAITTAGSGFALAWRDREGTRGRVHFTTIDAAGAEQIADHRISATDRDGVDVGGAVGFDRATIAILETATGFLAAWPESEQGDFSTGTGGQSQVRIVRLDASGVAQGTPVAVRTAEADIDEVEPSLVRYADGAVAVLWARGTHIYVCGGCVPDHRIDLVLVDPANLARLSGVVSVGNGGGRSAGGLLRRDVAVLGDSVFTTFDLTVHTQATPGSASFSCAR